jgi:hypothetical protein
MKAEGRDCRQSLCRKLHLSRQQEADHVALFGITGILTTIWYTAFFSGMSSCADRCMSTIDGRDDPAGIGPDRDGFLCHHRQMVGQVGRKKPIIIGSLLTLALLFPLFWLMGSACQPGLAEAQSATPVVVSGRECSTDPFAELFGREQTDCGKVLETLTASGRALYAHAWRNPGLTRRRQSGSHRSRWLNDGAARRSGIQAALGQYGFDFAKQTPPLANISASSRCCWRWGCSRR